MAAKKKAKVVATGRAKGATKGAMPATGVPKMGAKKAANAAAARGQALAQDAQRPKRKETTKQMAVRKSREAASLKRQDRVAKQIAAFQAKNPGKAVPKEMRKKMAKAARLAGAGRANGG